MTYSAVNHKKWKINKCERLKNVYCKCKYEYPYNLIFKYLKGLQCYTRAICLKKL